MIAHSRRDFRFSKLNAKVRPIRVVNLLIACVLMLVEGCLGSSDSGRAAEVVADTEGLSVVVRPSDGTYEIQTGNGGRTVMHARVAAEIDHKWVRSTDYPKHEISHSNFEDVLGHGKKITITSSGLPTFPDLAYTL